MQSLLPQRTVRRLLAEGQAGSYEKAELAAHLLSLSFDEDDSIAAAQECSSIYGALHFLQQECELCAEKYPMRNVRVLHMRAAVNTKPIRDTSTITILSILIKFREITALSHGK